MPRYVFTERELRGLRDLLSAPLVKRVLAASVPVRRFDAPGRPAPEEVELPVAVQSRARPDGVPLTELLAALKRESPSVGGIAVRGSAAFLTYEREPTAAERKRLQTLLGDRDKLERLRPADDDLERTLRDDAVPDDEWLRAFRRYATTRLLP